jgi:hypothetical protein
VKKSEKRKNILEFRCALFHFEAKITESKRSEKFKAKKTKKSKKVKRSEKLEAKTSENREVKFYSEIVKHM